ncbi:unnamed protein product, partial [Polarella glacialis]
MVASPGWPSLAFTSSARVRRRTPAVVSLGLVAVFFAPAKLAFSVGVSLAGAGCHHVRQRVCLNAGKASLEVSGSVEPLGSFVLVKVGAAEAETKSGILLAKSEKPKGGEAIAVGPGEADSDSGVVTPLTVAVGDQVVYSRYSGSEIMSVGGVEHVLVREDDILLRYTGDEPSVSSLSMPRGKILVKLQSSEEATDSGILLSKGAVKQSSTVGEVDMFDTRLLLLEQATCCLTDPSCLLQSRLATLSDFAMAMRLIWTSTTTDIQLSRCRTASPSGRQPEAKPATAKAAEGGSPNRIQMAFGATEAPPDSSNTRTRVARVRAEADMDRTLLPETTELSVMEDPLTTEERDALTRVRQHEVVVAALRTSVDELRNKK